MLLLFFFFSSRRRHTRFDCDWSSDVCSSDLEGGLAHGVRGQHLLVHRQDLALDLDLDGRVGGEEQVRGLLLHHQLEQRLGVEGGVTRARQRAHRFRLRRRLRAALGADRGIERLRFLGRLHSFWPCSSSTMRRLPPSSTTLCSRLLSSLMRRRSSFLDRKSTRLNSSHSQISYAVFCLKKKKKN